MTTAVEDDDFDFDFPVQTKRRPSTTRPQEQWKRRNIPTAAGVRSRSVGELRMFPPPHITGIDGVKKFLYPVAPTRFSCKDNAKTEFPKWPPGGAATSLQSELDTIPQLSRCKENDTHSHLVSQVNYSRHNNIKEEPWQIRRRATSFDETSRRASIHNWSRRSSECSASFHLPPSHSWTFH